MTSTNVTMEGYIKVLDKGFITLEDSMGDDLRIENAARVSYKKRANTASGKLINYLVKHRHGSPFEHVVFTFYVKAPLFVVREWQRHRMGSFNEVSGRYIKFEPDFYVPEQWRIPAETNKQGSVFPENSGEQEQWDYEAEISYTDALQDVYERYTFLIEHGVANEMARMVLPLSLYTEFFWTVNARSLMNFMSLRAAPDAQWEIQQYGLALKKLFAERMPLTYAAWEANGFIAP